ncbi:MAG TPA: R3H domain-containing nucleic acid-binding protein [Edaphobacter sp.]
MKKIEDFLQALKKLGGLDLKFNILACNGQVQPNAGDPAGETEPVATPEIPKKISVEFTGSDTPLLTARNGELLLAIEHIAAKLLRLEHEDHERISFDAENFKVLREQELRLAAEAAVEKVRRTGQPHAFNPMSSRERRLLHLALADSGLPTASSGLGPRRYVVLYPEGHQPSDPTPSAQDRTQAIRNTFRRR